MSEYDFSKDILPNDTDLSSVSTLTKRVLEKRDIICDLEMKLKAEKEELRELEEKLLPDALYAVGYGENSKIQIDGVQVSLKTDIQMSVSGENSRYRIPTISWLRETGHDDIIKNQLQIDLPKGTIDSEGLDKLKSYLQNMGFSYTQFENFHTATAKALFRSLLEQGEDIPLDQMGARLFTKANVKL
jgi:hypothetical protein